MSDIVERLREELGQEIDAHNMSRAEIERLKAHVAALSRTLNGIANREDFSAKVLEIADKALALEEKP